MRWGGRFKKFAKITIMNAVVTPTQNIPTKQQWLPVYINAVAGQRCRAGPSKTYKIFKTL